MRKMEENPRKRGVSFKKRVEFNIGNKCPFNLAIESLVNLYHNYFNRVVGGSQTSEG